MKHGKAPTKKQKIFLSRYRLNSKNWLVIKDCNEFFEIVHRVTENIRRLTKNRK